MSKAIILQFKNGVGVLIYNHYYLLKIAEKIKILLQKQNMHGHIGY